MRFLCLHGRGTNAKIFKIQMMKICNGLESGHEFVFIDGSIPRDPLLGQRSTEFNGEVGYLGFIPDDLNLSHGIIDGLFKFVESEGPFDGVIGFSEGGCVAANMIIEDARRSTPILGFKCAIFFSSITPVDMSLLAEGNHDIAVRHLSGAVDGILLDLPTAHIWSRDGDLLPCAGQDLVGICNESLREEYVHRLGHEIPGSRSDEGLRETLRVIERTIERAMSI